MDWAPITEPLLLERLTMDDDAFLAFIEQTFGSLPPRRLTPEALAIALGYPWERPARSYLLIGEEVELLDDAKPARRRALIAGRHTGPDGRPRHALLAFGSNGAPATLARKLAHFGPGERQVLVLAGALHGFDVGAAARPTAYGSMPATLFESPGTAVRAAVLWVSDAQFTQLCWTEITYRLGRLDAITFVPDQAEAEAIESAFTFASRWGVFCPDGEPVAQAAIPATGRIAPALTQEELLARAARLALGPDGSAEALVRAIFEDMGSLGAAGRARLGAAGRPFAAAGWTPFGPVPDAIG